MERILRFAKAQPVLVISLIAAVVTMFIVPPDSRYPGYINRTVLIELGALMAAVAGFRSIGIFDTVTAVILRRAGSIRRLGAVLVLICFFSAMLVTNDVALITFVPLTLLIYRNISDEKSRIMTIVLETVAANMGSMLTPVGNPQNLYLCDEYGLTAGTFVKTMLPAGILGLVCVMLLTLTLPAEPCKAPESVGGRTSPGKAAAYGAMFLLCLLTVFRAVPDLVCLAGALAIVLAATGGSWEDRLRTARHIRMLFRFCGKYSPYRCGKRIFLRDTGGSGGPHRSRTFTGHKQRSGGSHAVRFHR